MIKIDFNKLKEKNEHVQCIDLTEPENVKKDDCIHITVAHNYSNGDLAYSSSDCKVIGEFYNCDLQRQGMWAKTTPCHITGHI